MIKIDNVDVFGFESAVRGMRAKGYRKTKTGFETFLSVNGKSISLGTYKTEIEAKSAVYKFRINRFVNGVRKYNLNENDGVVINNKYVVFKSGDIFNLHGVKIVGMIDRCGYRELILNGKNHRVHRLVAEMFIPNPNNLPCVNHIDGNKLNNSVDNLEWVTLEENQRRAKKDLCQDCPVQAPSTKKYRYGHSQACDTIDEAVDWAIENFCHTDNAIRKNVQNKIINSINTGKLYCGAKWRLS